MGILYVRLDPGRYSSAQVSDKLVIHLVNSGMKIWTIGPTTVDRSETGAKGILESSTDKYPLPSPPM